MNPINKWLDDNNIRGKHIMLFGVVGLMLCAMCLTTEMYKQGMWQMCDDLGGKMYSGGFDGKKIKCLFNDTSKIKMVEMYQTAEEYVKQRSMFGSEDIDLNVTLIGE